MVTARIDLQGLNKEISSFKETFDSWAQLSVADAEARKESHFKTLRDFQTEIKNLNQEHANLERRAFEVQQRLQNENEEVKTLEEELAKIQSEQNKLPGLLAEVQEALETETRDAERHSRQLETKRGTREKTLSGVNRALKMYEERLGLEFHHNGGSEELAIVFTHIDAKDATRPFHIAIKVLENDRYEVRSCVPHFEGVQELVDRLNANNDFSKFVKNIRAAFQATARA